MHVGQMGSWDDGARCSLAVDHLQGSSDSRARDVGTRQLTQAEETLERRVLTFLRRAFASGSCSANKQTHYPPLTTHHPLSLAKRRRRSSPPEFPRLDCWDGPFAQRLSS